MRNTTSRAACPNRISMIQLTSKRSDLPSGLSQVINFDNHVIDAQEALR